MIKLIDVDIKEFRKSIYPEYVKLFPSLERKSLRTLKKAFGSGILKIKKAIDEDVFVGFVILNTLEDSKYLQLDYFAILQQYQNKGYGTQVLELLKETSKEYKGIFIEIEKLGLADNEKENELRKRRAKFYERIGFYKLKFDLELYKVIYSPYVLPISDIKENDDKIIEDIFRIYNAIFKGKSIEKHCKIICNKK